MIGKMEKFPIERQGKCKECKLIKMATDMKENGTKIWEMGGVFKYIMMGRGTMDTGEMDNDMVKDGK